MDQQWPQGLGFSAAAINSAVVSEGSCIGGGYPAPLAAVERRARPHKERALNCPRCNSGNTKFCYYNNYSLTQPRYFCKTCRRYWTEGGSLRNVPVGGGSRKNKRSSASKPSATATSSSSTSVAAAAHSRFYEVQDLNLGGAAVPDNYNAIPNLELISSNGNGSSIKGSGMAGATRGVVGPLMPVQEYSAGSFGMLQEEFRPAAALNFALDHGGKMLFPSEELKPAMVLPYLNLADRHHFEGHQHKAAGQSGGGQQPPPPPPPGFWNGLIHGGDGSW